MTKSNIPTWSIYVIILLLAMIFVVLLVGLVFPQIERYSASQLATDEARKQLEAISTEQTILRETFAAQPTSPPLPRRATQEAADNATREALLTTTATPRPTQTLTLLAPLQTETESARQSVAATGNAILATRGYKPPTPRP